jgi:hypothetical protein
MKTYALTLWLLCLTGCIEQSVQPDLPEPKADTGVDARPEDLGTKEDAARHDAVLPDASMLDAELPDAELPDAELPDAEAHDAEAPDAEAHDAAPRVPIDSPCPDDPNRGMVGAHMPDGRCYLIDAQPVTMGQYWAAEQAHGPLQSAEPLCAGFESAGFRTGVQFDTRHDGCSVSLWDDVLDDEGHQADPSVFWPPTPELINRPMHCINWCDAVAFCENAGKRLCANQVIADWRLHDADEARSFETNEAHDEWYNALTAGGAVGVPTTIGDYRGGFEGLDRMFSDYMGPFPMISFSVSHWSDVQFSNVEVVYGESDGRWDGAQRVPNYVLTPRDHMFAGIRCCDDAVAP